VYYQDILNMFVLISRKYLLNLIVINKGDENIINKTILFPYIAQVGIRSIGPIVSLAIKTTHKYLVSHL